MKLQESMLSVTQSSPLSSGVTSFLQDDGLGEKVPLGGILSDSRHGWLASGPHLCIVDLKTGNKVAAWTFGASLSLNASITCVSELTSPLYENTQQLAIGLACEDIGGLVAIFHCNGSQVLRCIQTKAIVTELAVVERTDGPLACCDSLIIAGTDMGELIVFDLNRTALIHALKNTSHGYEHLVRNEQKITYLAFLSLDDIGLIEEQREIALESDHHIAVNFNDQLYMDNEFVLRNPDGTVRMKAKRGHVSVTKLLFVPQLGSVIVGYNFGGFQIWNIARMCLEFTSAVNVECLPVVHFGFQEPCDDPRAFCYLWVVYSGNERSQDEASPFAAMFSLTYQGKRIPAGTQCLYQDFVGCTTRFELDLICPSEGDGQACGGRSLACHTYSIAPSSSEVGDDGVLNLCQLAWESWTDGGGPSHCTMLLFDLDQWYKGQMPERWSLENTTFMSVTSLDGVGSILDSMLLVSTVSPYTHVQRLEEHFYPNSLQYSIICISPESVLRLHSTGVQRQIISGMDAVGPTVLLHPTQLYRQCCAAGLTPLYAENYSVDANMTEQRKYLLSVALEGRLSQFLNKCARDWAMGSHSGAGCTLQLLVEWCWGRAMVLKQNARELTAPLLEQSGRAPDRNVSRCLEHCVRQLTLIVSLLDSVVTKCCNLIVPDALSDMEERCKAIGTVTTYFRLVQWFLSVGLLPSCSVDQEPHMLTDGDRRLPYPVPALTSRRNKRRLKLSCLEGTACSEENIATKSCSLLYIDQLIERECGGELVHNLWRTESNPGGLYPPPSLHALLRVYLVPEIMEEHKHSLVLYLLLDFSATFVEERYETIIRRLMQFPTMFGLSNSAIKATQAFWHLDQRNFDFALDQLQCLTGNTLTEWQHNLALSALLAQKKTQAALQYLHLRRPPVLHDKMADRRDEALEDWQSCCELYLARHLVAEALDVVRQCVPNSASVTERAEMLYFFFTGCKNTGQLSKILQLTLHPFEEDMYVKYLQSSKDKQCADILVMYYMQQARYLEAQRYNTKLHHPAQRSKELTHGSLESFADLAGDRDQLRDTLVDLFCTGLPRITDKVQANVTDLMATPRVINVKPMSVFVQAKSHKDFVYKSSFIQNSIENASETWIRKPQTVRGMKRALAVEETPFICTPKLNKSRSIFDQTLDAQLPMDGETPVKRRRMDAITPRTPAPSGAKTPSSRLSKEVQSMLDIPESHTPDWKILTREQIERSARDATPHSILKVRRTVEREQPSPVDSRYLADTDEEFETASHISNYTHTSDKHLRFTLPSSSPNSSSSPSNPSTPEASVLSLPSIPQPIAIDVADGRSEQDRSWSCSPRILDDRKKYKDSVKARLSHSLSANSSLNDGPNSSVESIADIPFVSINARRSREIVPKPRDEESEIAWAETRSPFADTTVGRNASEERDDASVSSVASDYSAASITPRCRPSIRSRCGVSPACKEAAVRLSKSPSSTPCTEKIINVAEKITPRRSSDTEETSAHQLVERSQRVVRTRSRSKTPERTDSPGFLSMPSPRPYILRSRSKTPEIKATSPRGSPNLEPIKEQPLFEPTEDNTSRKILRTPEKVTETTVEMRSSVTVKTVTTTITELVDETEAELEPPEKQLEVTLGSPVRRSLRSRSKTPDVPEVEPPEEEPPSVRMTRSRSKTPERQDLSPKLQSIGKSSKKKPLSRLVLEANVFSKICKSKAVEDNLKTSSKTSRVENTENESVKQSSSDAPLKGNVLDRLMANCGFSPIHNKSVLSDYSQDSILSNTPESDVSMSDLRSTKTETPLSVSFFDKSILGDYKSSPEVSESHSPTQLDKPQEYGELIEQITKTESPLSITFFDKSILGEYTSSPDVSESHSSTQLDKTQELYKAKGQILEYSASPIDPLSDESVLKDYSTTPTEGNILTDYLEDPIDENVPITSDLKPSTSSKGKESTIVQIESSTGDQDSIDELRDMQQKEERLDKVKQKIVEIESEINEMQEEIDIEDSDSSIEERSDFSGSDEEDDSGNESENSDEPSVEEDVEDDIEEIECSAEEDEEDTNEDANKAVCRSEIISLDSSDDAQCSPPKRARTSSESDSNSIRLEIDVSNEDIADPDSKYMENEFEKNIHSTIDDSEAESHVKDPLEQIEIQSNVDSSKNEDSSAAVDAFNKGNYSIMTDDNSAFATDHSEMDVATDHCEIDVTTDKRDTAMATELERKSESMPVHELETVQKHPKRQEPSSEAVIKSEPMTTGEEKLTASALRAADRTTRLAEPIFAFLTRKIEHETEPARESVHEPEPRRAPESESALETEPISKSRHIPESDSAASSVPVNKPSTIPELESTPESDPVFICRPVLESEPAPEAESVLELRPLPQSEPAPVSEPDPESDCVPESEPVLEPKVPESELLLSSQPEHEPEIVLDAASEPKRHSADAKPERKTDANNPEYLEYIAEEANRNEDYVMVDIATVNPIDKSRSSEEGPTEKIESAADIQEQHKVDTAVPNTSTAITAEPMDVESAVVPEPMEEVATSDETDSINHTRKRTKSTSSNSSKKSGKTEPPKISTRRSSTKSTTSTKSEDPSMQKTPIRRLRSKGSTAEENANTVDSETVQTPKNTKRPSSLKSYKSDDATEKKESETQMDTSKIETPVARALRLKIQQRALAKSKEAKEKQLPKEEEYSKKSAARRASRRSSKQSEDDHSSVKSIESKTSKDGDSVKPASIRKSRRISVIAKPDLSIIPEVEDSGAAVEGRTEDNSQMINEYSSSRRLTRHQRSMLERSLEMPRASTRVSRRASANSGASVSLASENDFDEESNRSEPFPVQSIDPISLLNKKGYEGSPDADELAHGTEYSASPDITAAPKRRTSRSASETVAIKELRRARRLSSEIDRASSPALSLDDSALASPGRARRSSFHKALEAMAAPKRGRRTSIDTKVEETDSVPGSPQPSGSKDGEVAATPQRRTRRTSSAASDTPGKKSPSRRTLRSSSKAESIEEEGAKK